MVVQSILRRLRAAAGPKVQLLHRIFEQQAASRPGNVAVACGDVGVTYGELDRKANRLARHLRDRDLRTGSVVATLLPRSPDAYAAILGILKAGGAYVPIDPSYPAERVSFILQDSGANGLVTTADIAWHFADFSGVIVSIDEERTAIAIRTSARLSNDEVRVTPGDPCCIFYTSGASGRPKGVILEHRNLSYLVEAEAAVFGVRPEDRVYQGGSLPFDLSVEEMWLAFRKGAAVVATSPSMVRAGADLVRFLTEQRVSVLSTVPSVLSRMRADAPTVRLLILGGEVCPPYLAALWARPGRRIVNTYGPTETGVTATFADLVPGKPVTIGRPLPGCEVRLLDEELRPVPAGAPGEICISGPGVARGYVGRPAETRARFVSDPSAPPDAPRRFYRSGDHGRLTPDGEIELLGRSALPGTREWTPRAGELRDRSERSSWQRGSQQHLPVA